MVFVALGYVLRPCDRYLEGDERGEEGEPRDESDVSEQGAERDESGEENQRGASID